MVEMRLSKIVINETAEQQVIVLQETEGERSFPIMIGIVEALAIRRGVRDETLARPQTHDLLLSVIAGLTDGLDHVEITELKSHTFFARLFVKRDGQLIDFDSRPSDAIALAVAAKRPIFCHESVLKEVSQG
jgi:bifunctional DNase/RNase